MRIDTSFDFNSEVPEGRDADSFSPTLHRFHQALWSKDLPSGAPLVLTGAGAPGTYHFIAHTTAGECALTSDTITNRMRNSPVARGLSEAERPPKRGYYTIGSALVFPGLIREGKQTINQSRGTHPRIADRFDLTLECIRRHYRRESSPLAAVLDRYADFFKLFVDFQGYVEFFFLQDLLDSDDTIRWFHEFADFATPAKPITRDAYLTYLTRSRDFIEARNRRIDDWQVSTA